MKPTLKTKLSILADAAKYDASCASSGAKRVRHSEGVGNSEGVGICHSYTPDGRCVSLLKILYTNYCIYDCAFCINRVSSDTPRARFTIEEVVWLTIEFYKRNYIEGLFLSSGIVGSPDNTMEDLAEVARQLRVIHHFGGYIHLKAVPGASPALIEKAGKHADRLSANIELATQEDLDRFAPAKSLPVINQTMEDIKVRIEDFRKDRSKLTPRFAPAGQSTQLVVGASDTTDKTILTTATKLYTGKHLKRIYYSAYNPIPHASPLLPSIRAPLLREHRLYQADWLFRFYGFQVNELFNDSSNLSLTHDPKEVWALCNRSIFPLNINTAAREMLLRVPGLGVRSVNRIIAARRHGALRFADLIKLRLPLSKVKFFVSTLDYTPAIKDLDSLALSIKIEKASQLTLPFMSVVGGEL